MKKIPLTKGKFAIVDDEDFETLSKFRWHYGQAYYGGYAKRTILESGSRWNSSMHRIILGLKKGDGLQVDHANGDKLDNRRANLRVCSHAENQRNRGLLRNNKSGFKGVCWNKYAAKWRGMIWVNKTNVFLGYFDDKRDAVRAYDEAARKYYGEFARPNLNTEK